MVNVKLSNDPLSIESGLRDNVFCKNYNLSIAYFVIDEDDLWVFWYCDTNVWSSDYYWTDYAFSGCFKFITFEEIRRLSQSSKRYSPSLNAMDSFNIILGFTLVLLL